MNKPTHTAHVVVAPKEGSDRKAQWHEVGAVWPHKSGKGFDLIIPAGEVPWTETYTRYATWAGAAKPYRFGLRHRFPKPIGLGA